MILAVIFGVIGVIGTIGTIYFGCQYRLLAQQRYRFSWTDVEKGALLLARCCLTRFKPDAVLTFSGPGSIIASLAFVYAAKDVPVYTVSDFPANVSPPPELDDTHIRAQTAKWHLYIPRAFLTYADRRVAIIHDSCISGTGIASVLKKLLDAGFRRSQIQVGCLVCTNAAKDAGLAPDHYAYLVENNEFHYPWGKRV